MNQEEYNEYSEEYSEEYNGTEYSNTGEEFNTNENA
jgi:hypothetical protein